MFQVAILWDTTDLSRQQCGGSLITEKHVVTKRSCASGDRTYYVHLGDTILGNDKDVNYNKTVLVTNKYIHPDYAWPVNDIAILEMAEPVMLDKFPNIKPLCLPQTNSNFVEGTVTGWAYNGVNGYNSWLHQSNITVSENSDETKLSGNDINISSCYGDTGGPLVVSDPANNNGLTLAGVSDDNNCKTFIKVSTLMDWINNVISDSNVCPSPP